MPLPLAATVALIASAANSLVSIGGAATEAINSILPVFEDQVEVTVYGNRAARRSDLYRLALSLAFGKVQSQNALKNWVPPGMISMTYDCVNRVVKVFLHFKYGGITNIAGGFNSRMNALFKGPDDTCYGGPWSYYSIGLATGTSATPGTSGAENALIAAEQLMPGITSYAPPQTRPIGEPVAVGGAPNLDQFLNKPILTPDENTSNPSLPIGGMRGTYAERLAFQFLSNPCEDPLVATTAAAITAAKQGQAIKDATDPGLWTSLTNQAGTAINQLVGGGG